MKKESYFQGTEEPKPKKKQYKSEKAISIQPRFKEPLFRNFDSYETPGKHTPGAGYHSLTKYKSVKDFIEAKRKRNKEKYKADDSWIDENGNITKANIKNIIIKYAIDFPTDEQIKSDPILPLEQNSYGDSVYLGGREDFGIPVRDFESKKPEELDFGRDYTDDNESFISDEKLGELLEKYLNSAETPLLGLSDGLDNTEKDVDQTISKQNPFFGNTDLGITMYNDSGNKLI